MMNIDKKVINIKYKENNSVRILNPKKPIKPSVNSKKVTCKELFEFKDNYCSYYELNDCCEECEYYQRGCHMKLVDDNFEIYQVIK